MKKICRTCEYWRVTGSGKYGHAMFPGSWGTERRETGDTKCRCTIRARHFDTWTASNDNCPNWTQASDIIDECEHCGALLFEYARPKDPENPREHYRNGKTRFWYGGIRGCEHSGINYHGNDPWLCGMCQGYGGTWIKNLGAVPCDACHGKGIKD
jgi:hypothetical protein